MKRLPWILCAGGLLLFVRPADSLAQDMTVEAFVRQIYVEGIPYEAADAYDEEAVPRLLEMLADSTEAPYWANIVVTLCIIGDARAVEPVIAFIEEDAAGELSQPRYRAKSSAVMALGYLINKTGNQQALDYLTASLRPDAWQARDIQWRGPFQPDAQVRDVQLSTMAILGLALSGRPEAAEALRTLQEPAATDEGRRFRSQVGGVVEEALRAHERIAEQGLAAYYEQERGGM